MSNQNWCTYLDCSSPICLRIIAFLPYLTAIPKDELEAALHMLRGDSRVHYCSPAATVAYNHIHPEVVNKETNATGERIQYTRYGVIARVTRCVV